MMLHFQSHEGEVRFFALKPQGRQGATVWLGDRRLGKFSTMAEAVQAVDEELPKYGPAQSADPGAAWRLAPLPDPLRCAVEALRPPRYAPDVGTALAHLALAQALEG